MYASIIGVWVTGQLPPERPGSPSRARRAQAIEWPQGEDGTILMTLIDQLGQPVELGEGDSAKLAIAWDLRTGPQTELTATAGTDAGVYLFTLTPASTRDFSGPMVFSVTAVKGGLTQQVVPLGYFTISQGAAPP